MNSRMLPAALSASFSICCFAVPTAAQAVISPPHFATAEGSTAHFPPFGDTVLPAVWQQVDAGLIGQPRTITELRFRRDGLEFAPFAASTCVLEVHLSHAATTPATMQASLAANAGPGRVLVRSGTLVVPASAWTRYPAPFEFAIPVAPFAYDGVAPLCWEIRVTSRAPLFLMRCDQATGANLNPAPIDVAFGAGCPVAGSSRPTRLVASAGGTWGGSNPSMTFTWNGTYLPANSSGILVLDLAAASPLPIGSACTSLVRSNVWSLVLTQANGTFLHRATVPVSPAINGVSLVAQCYALSAANLLATNAAQVQLVAPWTAVPVSSVRQVGNGAPQLMRHRGFVVEYR